MLKTYTYLNREISWLSFNERVLQEAQDKKLPLIERLKFLGIYSSNLDEFFSVRVGTLKRIINSGVKSKSIIGSSPKKTLIEIQTRVLKNRYVFEALFNEIKNELEKENIYIINEQEIDEDGEEFLKDYFNREVRSRLIPIMLSSHKEFPYLKNLVVYLALYLVKKSAPTKPDYALIEIPTDVLPRFVILPSKGNRINIIMIDDLIRFSLKNIFAVFEYDQLSAYALKITRDAEIDIQDDVTKSLFEKISRSVKQRQTGQPVRIVFDEEMPKDLLHFILKKNDLSDFPNMVPGGRYHNARDFMNFPEINNKKLIHPAMQNLPHRVMENQPSIFRIMDKQDLLMHYPYQSFRYFIDFLREAAIDPQVVSIKMTLYRVARNSNVINALINAVHNGKEVTVIMELQARFDEEANIYWTRKLEEAGARVISGIQGLKVHAKLCLVKRKQGKGGKLYANISTGNYNESTAKLYVDHSLFTANEKITKEIDHVFDFLENNYKSYAYKHLLVGPYLFRSKISAMIDNEIKNAEKGLKAEIRVKLNSFVDKILADKLYKASQSGVKVRMVIRGICSLIAGKNKLSENIEIVSIVDRFLEHSRIYYFYNNGKPKVYLSSADWMIRNLDNRVEVAVPIYDKQIQKELYDFIDIQLSDNVKARLIDSDMSNRFKESTGVKVRAQKEITNYLKKITEVSEGD